MPLATFAVLALMVPLADADRPAKAKALVDAMVKNDFAAAVKDFDETMKKVLPKEKLEALWKAVGQQFGAFQKVTAVKETKLGTSNLVDLSCEFAKKPYGIRVAFDKDDRIQGFFFIDPTPPKFDPPPYAKASSYREEEVTIGAGGEWPLPGTLTLPKEKGPFACVVLVHGSGSHDRDETIGPNKTFRDLAWGLGSKGVAVLRYVKRNKAHTDKLMKLKDSVTLKEEVIDDVLEAVKMVRMHKEIDPKRIFVLGHSLGAMCAPRIGELDPSLAGLILLAGNSRPLEDLVLDQFTYIYSLNGGPTDKQKAELEAMKKKVAKVKDPKLSNETPATELPLGIPAAYWKALGAYHQAGSAARGKVPMLVLQGERDYQVTMEDFAGWKKACALRKDVTFKSYASLNHLFLAGKGKSRPEEYAQAGHVAVEVIDDVAAWVKGR